MLLPVRVREPAPPMPEAANGSRAAQRFDFFPLLHIIDFSSLDMPPAPPYAVASGFSRPAAEADATKCRSEALLLLARVSSFFARCRFIF